MLNEITGIGELQVNLKRFRDDYLRILTSDQECWERYTDIHMIIDSNLSFQNFSYENELREEYITEINNLIQTINKKVMYLLLSGKRG